MPSLVLKPTHKPVKAYCAGRDRQIDALVYELCGLTPDEIKIVERTMQ